MPQQKDTTIIFSCSKQRKKSLKNHFREEVKEEDKGSATQLNHNKTFEKGMFPCR
jgi:hypothetical protein